MDHLVVMAGGSGTRFWPESRMRRSKQFLNLTGKGPMVSETIRRLLPLFRRENIWIVAGEKDAPHLRPPPHGVPRRNLLLEPQGKNTAPAVALAAARILRRDPEAVVVATPADHAIAREGAFRKALRKGLRLARRTGRFVTLGIPPTHPATGYGYIERGESFLPGGADVFDVVRFTEKPDADTARRFLATDRFDWNSGVFVFRALDFEERLSRHLPEIASGMSRALRASGTKRFAGALRHAYRGFPSVSVDYGILEKERNILVIRGAFGWSDLGTWRSLHEFLVPPGENVSFGNVVLEDCRDVLARTDAGVVAVLGMEGVVVVRSGDAVLVCPLERSEQVKRLAGEIARRHPAQA